MRDRQRCSSCWRRWCACSSSRWPPTTSDGSPWGWRSPTSCSPYELSRLPRPPLTSGHDWDAANGYTYARRVLKQGLERPSTRRSNHMADLGFDGKVAIITGAGGGLGRSHALDLAQRGALLVINDLGGAADGTGHSETAAQKVVDEIKSAGGEAVASYGPWPPPKACRRS